MVYSSNKSSLAPKADKQATEQLSFLIVNMPFTVVLNNYKSGLKNLDSLRLLINKSNGFAYHPNKNVKSRAFKGFNAVLSSNVLNGLVVFAFFKSYLDMKFFLNSLEAKGDLTSLTYFSVLIDGHIPNFNLSLLNNLLATSTKQHTMIQTSCYCNKILFDGAL